MDLSLAKLPISELRKTPEGLELIRDAVAQTAIAYYYKRPYTQYEAAPVTAVECIYYSPHYRHVDAMPEFAEWDTRYFNLCRGFTHDVYHAALCDKDGNGYQTMGGNVYDLNGYHARKNDFFASNSYVMFHDDDGEKSQFSNYKPDGLTHKQAVDKMNEMLLPGDIIDGDGHLLFYIGDALGKGRRDVLHCWPTSGGAYRPDRGKEHKYEPFGAITCQSMDALILNSRRAKGTPSWYMYEEVSSRDDFGIHRPYMDDAMTDYYLSPSAIARVRYRGITLSKCADRSVYDHVAEGECFTVTLKIANRGGAAFKDIPFSETVPEGCELVSAPGAVVSGRTLSWVATVEPKETCTVSYTLRVTAKRGEMISVPAGDCGGIATRDFTLKVGVSHITEEQKALLDETAYNLNGFPELLDFDDLRQAKRFYEKALGFCPELPDTVDEFVKATMKKAAVQSDPEGNTMEMLVPAERTKANAAYLDQIPNKLLTGRYVYLGKHLSARIAEFREEYFEIGDIIMTYGSLTSENTVELKNDEDVKIYIYLGYNRVAEFSKERVGVFLFSTTVECAYGNSCFVVARPTMVR